MMAVERYQVGKNAYNRRERVSIGMGAEDAEALRDAFVELAKWTTPEKRIAPAVAWATAILEQKNMPFDPNAWCYSDSDKDWRRKNERRSAEWYAITILQTAEWMRQMIDKGDARMAADFGLDLGELIAEGRFILGALAGTAARGGKEKAANAREKVESRIAECRRQAVALWRRHRDSSATEVARNIKNVRLAPSYIRKKITDLDPKKR
jgi:hypothetical protein